MREIKFRAWAKGSKIMLINVGIHPFITELHDGYEWQQEGGFTIGTKMENYVLMQFTGLHDKNGKEIWEGDIVEYTFSLDRDERSNETKERAIVQFQDGEFKPRPYRFECEDYWYSYELNDFSVIGNIYENPELLK